MSLDRDLLELAAKAAGIRIFGFNHIGYAITRGHDSRPIGWNPLTDDGDALRLAVKLRIDIVNIGLTVRGRAHRNEGEKIEVAEFSQDRNVDTRRAIVRAAAEIGEMAQSK